MIICIDFDGTCVTHEFPKIGKDIGAQAVLRKLIAAGHRLILFTMRSDVDNPESDNPEIHAYKGMYLTDAVNWFSENNIGLWGVNTNPEQFKWTQSPKAYGQLYIDDAALGCPLKTDPAFSDRPFADWAVIEKMLIGIGIIT